MPWTVESTLSDEAGFEAMRSRLQTDDAALAWLPPRGIGPTAWSGNEKKRIQIRRRFMLIGQTLDGMRVWDIRRSVQALGAVGGGSAPVWLEAEGGMAANALLAGLFESGVGGLSLARLPAGYRTAPDYLNLARVADLPQILGMVASERIVELREADIREWEFASDAVARWGASENLQIHRHAD
jgi:hypothetical protein